MGPEVAIGNEKTSLGSSHCIANPKASFMSFCFAKLHCCSEGFISPNSLKLLSLHFPRCCPGLADGPPGTYGAGAKLLRVDLTGSSAGCQPHLLDPLYTGPGSFMVSSTLKHGQAGPVRLHLYLAGRSLVHYSEIWTHYLFTNINCPGISAEHGGRPQSR